MPTRAGCSIRKGSQELEVRASSPEQHPHGHRAAPWYLYKVGRAGLVILTRHSLVRVWIGRAAAQRVRA